MDGLKIFPHFCDLSSPSAPPRWPLPFCFITHFHGLFSSSGRLRTTPGVTPGPRAPKKPFRTPERERMGERARDQGHGLFYQGAAEMPSAACVLPCNGPGGLQQSPTCPAARPCPSCPRFINNLVIKPSSRSWAGRGAGGPAGRGDPAFPSGHPEESHRL